MATILYLTGLVGNGADTAFIGGRENQPGPPGEKRCVPSPLTHRSPRRWRGNTSSMRFMVPMRGRKTVEAPPEPERRAPIRRRESGAEAASYCASASGVRAASAPLWLWDGSNQGFRGSRREILFREILSSSDGE